MKKILIVFFLIMLILTFFRIINMYALYKTELEGNYQTKLGVWNIDINNENITASEFTEFSNKLNLQKVESSKSAYEKIAPGDKFSVELNINPKDTDVSILYEIEYANIKTELDEKIKEMLQIEEINWNIEFVEAKSVFCKGEEEIEQDEELENSTNTKYIGIFPLEMIKNQYTNKVNIIFRWINDDQNNDVDSILGEPVLTQNDENEDEIEEDIYLNNQLEVTINIKLKQYIGEDISDEEGDNEI